jgi:ABC-type multidrug transport system fused ATPase/permease subunit
MIVTQETCLFEESLKTNLDPLLDKEEEEEALSLLKELGFVNPEFLN